MVFRNKGKEIIEIDRSLDRKKNYYRTNSQLRVEANIFQSFKIIKLKVFKKMKRR